MGVRRWERARGDLVWFPWFFIIKACIGILENFLFFLFSNVKLFVPKQFPPYLSFKITSEHFAMLKMLKVCTIYFIPRSIGIRFQKHNMKPLSEISGWHKSLLWWAEDLLNVETVLPLPVYTHHLCFNLFLVVCISNSLAKWEGNLKA